MDPRTQIPSFCAQLSSVTQCQGPGNERPRGGTQSSPFVPGRGQEPGGSSATSLPLEGDTGNLPGGCLLWRELLVPGAAHKQQSSAAPPPPCVFYLNQDNLLPGKHDLIEIPWLCFQVNIQDRSQTPPAAGNKYRAARGWALHWEAEWNRWEFTQSI